MKTLWLRHIKGYGTLLIGFSCLSAAASADNVKYMTLYTGVSTQSVMLDDIDKITFDGNTMNVRMVSGSMLPVKFEDLFKCTFDETDKTGGVEQVVNDESRLLSICYQSSVQGIVVSSVSPIESIELYSLQGRLMKRSVPLTGSYTLPVGEIEPGIYLVRVNNGRNITTKKIIKN